MGFVMRTSAAVLLAVMLIGCGGGGGTADPVPQVVHPTIAPQMTGEVTTTNGTSAIHGSSQTDPLIVRIIVRNNNPPGVDVETIRYCLKHDPNEDNPLTKPEAKGYLDPVPPTLPANVDVQEVPYTGSPQTIEISQFKGTPLTPNDRYWLSAVFVSSDGVAGPVTDPLRFKVMFKYVIVDPPEIGILKTFTGHVYDDQGELLPNAFVQYFHEGVFLEADVTDDEGAYYFEVEVPPVGGSSSLKEGSTGEAEGETQFVLQAYHPDYDWEPKKYLDPEYVNYVVDLSFEKESDARGDWWMYGHDIRHTGRSPFNGPVTNTLKWSFDTGGDVYSSAALVADGTIYIGSYNGKLYAINLDGSEKWSFTTGDRVIGSPAIGVDGTIYVGSYDDKLYAINPDGTKKWTYTTEADLPSCPTIGTDGTVYIGGYDNNLYAINPDGSLKWLYTTGGDIQASPAIATDGTVYVGSEDGKLYAINSDGTKKWSYTTGGYVLTTAIAADGTIYAPSNDYNLYAINPDGTKKWSFEAEHQIRCMPAIGIDGTIFVGTSDNKLYAINPDGSEKWSYLTGGYLQGGASISAEGTVYIGSFDNKVYAINADGSLKWEYETGGMVISVPAISADGTVYVGSHDGKLYAFGD